jgi:2-amino-4-hydroxy-6-hydroxymethyldihydropteridine diphosphokinase
VEAASSIYETEPVGEILDQPDFLNAAVRIRTALEPEELLDLYLLLLGDLELSTERLTLPHPQVASRRFVLAPLLELDPGLRLPDGTELRAALRDLGSEQQVERVGPLD